jgi:hypothetical protein
MSPYWQIWPKQVCISLIQLGSGGTCGRTKATAKIGIMIDQVIQNVTSLVQGGIIEIIFIRVDQNVTSLVCHCNGVSNIPALHSFVAAGHQTIQFLFLTSRCLFCALAVIWEPTECDDFQMKYILVAIAFCQSDGVEVVLADAERLPQSRM